MNYKKDISFNSCEVIVEFTFSTNFVLIFTLYLLAILSIKILRTIYFLQNLIDGFPQGEYFYEFNYKQSRSLFKSCTNYSFRNYSLILISKSLFHSCSCRNFLLHLKVYSSIYGSKMYTRARESRPSPVISLNLEKASLHFFQESKYKDD